jgi:hypothetical protein
VNISQPKLRSEKFDDGGDDDDDDDDNNNNNNNNNNNKGGLSLPTVHPFRGVSCNLFSLFLGRSPKIRHCYRPLLL